MIASGASISLDSADAALLGELLQSWQDHRPRNLTRTAYYDGSMILKDFGISLPPQMRSIEAALGWTAKGVNAVTDRSRFESFVSPAGSEDPFDLEGIMYDNHFRSEFPQAKVSSAVHACSFLTVTSGDTQAGEPEILVLARAADDSAALWDRRRRALRGFLSIVDVSEDGTPTVMVMHTPEKVVTLTRSGGKWTVDVRRNPLGVVSVAPLRYKPELKRPLGHSRITRASMYFSDAALRTIVRAEVSSEFYSAPEYYLFGANVQGFIGNDKWSAVMGRIKALDVEDGEDKPDLHQFTGASPLPHTEQLRMWANLFADDQDMDVKFADNSNPSSADAIFAAKETLITVARDANEVWGLGAVEAMTLAVRLRDGLDEVPDELRRLAAQSTDPAVVSPSAQSDAFVKRASVIPDLARTEVGLEMAGFSREQIARYLEQSRRLEVGSRLTQLIEATKQIRGTDAVSSAGSGVPGGEPVASGTGAA